MNNCLPSPLNFNPSTGELCRMGEQSKFSRTRNTRGLDFSFFRQSSILVLSLVTCGDDETTVGAKHRMAHVRFLREFSGLSLRLYVYSIVSQVLPC